MQTSQKDNLNHFDQQHNQLVFQPLQNEKSNIETIPMNLDEIEPIKSNDKEEFNFPELNDFDAFSQDFADLPLQNNDAIEF